MKEKDIDILMFDSLVLNDERKVNLINDEFFFELDLESDYPDELKKINGKVSIYRADTILSILETFYKIMLIYIKTENKEGISLDSIAFKGFHPENEPEFYLYCRYFFDKYPELGILKQNEFFKLEGKMIDKVNTNSYYVYDNNFDYYKLWHYLFLDIEREKDISLKNIKSKILIKLGVI